MLISEDNVPVHVPVTCTRTVSKVDRENEAADPAVGVPVIRIWPLLLTTEVDAESTTETLCVEGAVSGTGIEDKDPVTGTLPELSVCTCTAFPLGSLKGNT